MVPIHRIGKATAGLDTFSSRATYDESYKNIYSLFIKKIINDTLTISEDSLVLEIALNPEDSSLANFIAITLFNPCISEEIIPFKRPETPHKEIIPSTGSEFTDIYNSNLTSNLNNPNSNYELELFDLSGRLIFKTLISDGFEKIIQRATIVPGLYVWRLMDIDDS